MSEPMKGENYNHGSAHGSEISKVDLGKLLNTLGGIVLMICAGILAHVMNELKELSSQHNGLDRRVTTIEASRFSAEDGKEVWREFAGLREVLARLPKEYPEPWFRKLVEERFAAIQANQDETRRAIDALAKKLESR